MCVNGRFACLWPWRFSPVSVSVLVLLWHICTYLPVPPGLIALLNLWAVCRGNLTCLLISEAVCLWRGLYDHNLSSPEEVVCMELVLTKVGQCRQVKYFLYCNLLHFCLFHRPVGAHVLAYWRSLWQLSLDGASCIKEVSPSFPSSHTLLSQGPWVLWLQNQRDVFPLSPGNPE